MSASGRKRLDNGGHRTDSPSWVSDAVFYGVDIARFYDGNGDGFGDLRGLTEKLDYLRDLDVTCLWLLPFFPSDRGDNGYDVTDFIGVDPRFGTLDDFRTLATEAHKRGIRIMTDLVVHHSSARHPWFQAAECDPGSRYMNYYVWSKEKPSHDEWQTVFPEEEDGIWDYSERAGAYYRHTFYHFQPDLKLANDEVWDDVKRIVDFWIAVGVDAFRIDAATLMFREKEGPSFEERFDDLHDYLAERAPYVALLGEADVAVDSISRYFENSRFNLLYGFLSNNALYLSIVRESAAPLLGTISELAPVVRNGRFLNFLRNLDELDLDQLTEDERNEVFAALAPEKNMRIYGRGIRRGWAPMMRTEEQLRMTLSLLFALPGVPLLVYGQEIGMGDNLALPGREVVRLPMQWSSDPAGGFTENADGSIADDRIVEIAQADGERGYRRINVSAQLDDPKSLLALARQLAGLRRRYPSIGNPGWEPVDAHCDALLILRYEDVIVVHNLSASQQQLPDLGVRRGLLGEDLTGAQIPAYGFGWAQR